MDLVWTKNAPTVEGAYLMKHPDGEIDACMVYRQDEIYGGPLFYSGALFHGGPVNNPDGERVGFAPMMDGVMWAGPIPMPKEPS